MKSLSRENQVDIIEAFNSTSRYLDLLNIDNVYFDQMVDRIYPTELQLNRANSSDTEAPFLDLCLCVSNGTLSARVYDGGAILILMWSISLFWVAVSPGVPRVGYTCLSLLGSPELLRVLVALAAVVGPLLSGFLGGAVVILNFVGVFGVL